MSNYGIEPSPLDVTIEAGLALGEFLAVTQDATGQAVLPAAGASILGFTKASGSVSMPLAQGDKVTIGVGDFQLARVGAAILTPSEVEVDANGYIVPLAAGASVGRVLSTAAIDDVVVVLLR